MIPHRPVGFRGGLSPFGFTARQMMWTLAVGHRAMGRDQREAAPYPVPSPGQTARGYVYHVEEYMRECVDLYCSLLGISKNRLKRGVKTLFPDRPKETSMLGGRGDRRLHRLDCD